jgi:hypothetical protein
LSTFFLNFDATPQILNPVAQRFYSLATLYTEYLLPHDAMIGLNPLRTAIAKIQANPSSEELSAYAFTVCGSLHREFAKLAIKTKCYQHSLKVIDHPVVGFTRGTQAMEIIGYLYYKGIIYTSQKRYEEAIEQF